MNGDNFQLDITSEGIEKFKKAFEFFEQDYVVGYRIENNNRMVVYHVKCQQAIPLPYNMEINTFCEFAYGWLKNADYGTEPDHDGGNEKGWRIYCDEWGHVDGEWQAFACIEPKWMMYGK